MRRILLFPFLFISIFSFAQIGNETGKYDRVVDIGYEIISDMKDGNVPSVLKRFKSSGMQTKKELKGVLCDSNLQWFSSIVEEFGLADRSLIGISEMTTSRNDNSSINLTYYFKTSDSDFSLTCDHVSMNFQKHGDEYLLDGMMFFRRDEYLMLKQFVDRL